MSVPDDSDPGQSSLKQKLLQIKEAIWERRPIFGEIIRNNGQKNLYQYTKEFLNFRTSQFFTSRQFELISITNKLVGSRLGKDVGDAVARQLIKYPLVSTTDHHGPIDHPFFVNANIISSLPYHEQNDSDLDHLIVFSFASVSINNLSAYPRGILFHGGINGTKNLIRLSFFTDKEKMGVVYDTRAYQQADIDRAHQELTRKYNQGEIANEKKELIHTLLDEFFAHSNILDSPNLATQITKINYQLWPKLFHSTDQYKSADRNKAPQLVYLEIETLVSEILQKFHFTDKNSPLYRLIFDPEFRLRAKELFEDIPGAFSTADKWGSYLFWAMNDRKHRKRLLLDGNKLIGQDIDYELELTPKAVQSALQQKKIFPSMLLCYLTVALYYGFKCLGGFSQVNDLTMTKMAWQELLWEYNLLDEALALETVSTASYGGDGLVLSYLPTQSGSIVPATGIDMMLEKINTSYDDYLALAKNTKLEEILNPMLPEMYNVVHHSKERIPELSNLTPEQIIKATGLQNKLVRLATPYVQPTKIFSSADQKTR
ncbi:MAG: hypothetical protein WC693_04340 [Patescibacteria group bacterium]|jgi:hypothetical protein